MKKLTTLGCFIFFFLTAYNQNEITLQGTVNGNFSTLNFNKLLKKGDRVSVSQYTVLDIGTNIMVKIGDIKDFADIKCVEKIDFDPPRSREELWYQQLILSDYINKFADKGYQYDLRHELDESSIEYLQNIEKYGGFFKDEYLEEYLQSLLAFIHSSTLSDERPGNLNVKILNLSEPNAYSLPNGTILITAGLLSILDSEEELVAVLSHEVAHFVLDHQVSNINALNDKQKRAEFWAGLATLAAAATEVYMAAEKDIYLEGNLTFATAAIGSQIAYSMIENFGLKYSIEQELEADKVARNVLLFNHIDPSAYSSMLKKIRSYLSNIGEYFALSGGGTHPSLNTRINAGNVDTVNFTDPQYNVRLSKVISQTAIFEYRNSHFESCEKFLDRLIEANVATEEDYILKSMVMRKLYNSKEKLQEALSYLKKAETLNVYPVIALDKQKGLNYLRLKNQEMAIASFNAYLSLLENQEPSDFIDSEIEWTKKTIYMAKGLYK